MIRVLFEIGWIAICGTAAVVVFIMLRDALATQRAVGEALSLGEVQGLEAEAQELVADKAARLEKVRLTEAILLTLMGLLSMLLPPPVYLEELLWLRGLIGVAAMGMAVMLCLNAIRDKSDRARLRAIIRQRLRDEARVQAEAHRPSEKHTETLAGGTENASTKASH